MFRIKICGLTRIEDGTAVVEAGADAVGLNFYPRSLRFLPRQQAEAMVAVLGSRVVKVGLFVNADAADVCRTFDELGLDLIQLHGDEPPAYLAELGTRPVLRAFRLDHRGFPPLVDYLAECGRLQRLPRMVLVDAHVKGHYGGTGQTADWQLARQYPADGPPLVLAGGLTPDNVADAIAAVRPRAVDTASGVECDPGVKSASLIRRFVESARAAFGRMGSDEQVRQ